MKKLLNLLSVLTVSGTAVPTTIAASPYQKENNNEISYNNYQQTNNLEKLIRNKRDFYNKEQIEFFENNFFYKFNINYNEIKEAEGAWNFNSSREFGDSIVLIEDWTKYASSWEEFETKFPEIEFINLRAKLSGGGKLSEKKHDIFKIKTKLNKDFKYWNEKWDENLYSNIRNIIASKNNSGKTTCRQGYSSEYTNIFNNNLDYLNLNEINYYNHNDGLACQKSINLIRIYPENKKLMLQNYFTFITSNSFVTPKGNLKFDSIRLVGEIDINPLLNLTIEKSKQFDNWAFNKEKELKDKREDPNYNKNHLLNEENSFKENFKLWLLQIRHDYIQDLINISQDNKIINLKSEIDDLKSRLDRLEQPKTCLDNIFDAFKKNSLSSAPGDAWKSIKENSTSPLKIIIKKSGKAFATGLVTGIAKGSALGIISCVAESIV